MQQVGQVPFKTTWINVVLISLFVPGTMGINKGIFFSMLP